MKLELIHYERDPTCKQGNPLQGVPERVRELLPDLHFLQPRNLPGVFGFYFPSHDTFYFGESKRVSFEMSMYRTGQRRQITLAQLFQENKDTVFSFALFLGPGLQEKSVRRAIETHLIQQTAGHTLNIIGSGRQGQVPVSVHAGTSFLTFELVVGPLTDYNLEFVGSEPPRGEACVYIIINSRSTRFYLGESKDFYKNRVLKRHKKDLFAVKKRNQVDLVIRGDRVIQEWAADLEEDENILVYACLECLGNATKRQRLEAETRYKMLAQHQYETRMYNQLNFLPKRGQQSHSEETKRKLADIARAQTKTLDTTAYPCIVQGKWYTSRAEASFATGYKSADGLKYKLMNPTETDYIWLKDTRGKPIPPEFEDAVRNFQVNLQRKTRRIIPPKGTEECLDD